MLSSRTTTVPVTADWLERVDHELARALLHAEQARQLLINTGKYREEIERGKKQHAHEHILRVIEAIKLAAQPF